MTKIELTKESEFIVGENKLMNDILAILFLAIFLYGLGDAVSRNFKNIDYQSYVLTLALIPVVYCLRRANSKRVYIRINKNGIYKDEQIVTGWSTLLNYYLAQEKKKKYGITSSW